MPIAVISVDSENYQLGDFKDLTESYTYVFLPTTTEGSLLFNNLIKMGIKVENIKPTERLDPPTNQESNDQIKNRFQSVVDECYGPCIIISNHTTINTWSPNFIKNEWSVV